MGSPSLVMARAAIDIGSNSILLTVLDNAGQILVDEARVVGLGLGVDQSQNLQTERMQLGYSVLRDYVQLAAAHGVAAGQIRAAATSAARRAHNARAWFAQIKETLGLSVDIISGAEEARLTWLGAMTDMPQPEQATLVVDLGGGSTELVFSQGSTIVARTSVELGSVRETERFLNQPPYQEAQLAQLAAFIDAQLADVDWPFAPKRCVAVAGTATTLATLALKLEHYDRTSLQHCTLSQHDLSQAITTLKDMSTEEQAKHVPASPARAPYLVAGAMILTRVLSASSCPSYVISDSGLRFGLLATDYRREPLP